MSTVVRCKDCHAPSEIIVFDDFNLLQREKVVAATNTAFSEVWWFYPSADLAIPMTGM